MRLFKILKQNKLGILIGLIYGVISLLIFYFGLGYGASCPDAYPCNPIIMFLLKVLTTLAWPAILLGSALYFLLQRGFGLSLITTFLSFVILLAFWGAVGILLQMLLGYGWRCFKK